MPRWRCALQSPPWHWIVRLARLRITAVRRTQERPRPDRGSRRFLYVEAPIDPSLQDPLVDEHFAQGYDHGSRPIMAETRAGVFYSVHPKHLPAKALQRYPAAKAAG
jgi:hypothetical protein